MPDSPAGDPTVNEALFQRAIAVVLRNEGGDALTSDASGGLTKYGWALLKNPDLTADDVRNMTEAQAIDRYRNRFWAPFHWWELPDSIAVKCFDMAVNLGPSPSVRCLQRALWAAGKHLKEDGLLGTLTVTAVGDVQAPVLLAALRSEAAAHYRIIAATQPTLSGALTGWLNRAYQ